MNNLYIEQHYALGVSEFEGFWQMTFRDPRNRAEHVTVYLEAPNSHEFNRPNDGIQIAKPGARLEEVLRKLLPSIQAYPYKWPFDGQKIVGYAYDFETDMTGTSLGFVDLTEIAFKQVMEELNLFSPLAQNVVGEDDLVSGKGVMAKFRITLDRPKRINHLSLDFFTEYPMELMSLMYQEDESKNATLYEIPLLKKTETNTSTYLHFAPVFAKVFHVIIRQETYTLINNNSNPDDIENENLWEVASEESKRIYEAAAEEYLEGLVNSKSAVLLHQEVMDSYYATKGPEGSVSEGPLNPYRVDFQRKKKALDREQR